MKPQGTDSELQVWVYVLKILSKTDVVVSSLKVVVPGDMEAIDPLGIDFPLMFELFHCPERPQRPHRLAQHRETVHEELLHGRVPVVDLHAEDEQRPQHQPADLVHYVLIGEDGTQSASQCFSPVFSDFLNTNASFLWQEKGGVVIGVDDERPHCVKKDRGTIGSGHAEPNITVCRALVEAG